MEETFVLPGLSFFCLLLILLITVVIAVACQVSPVYQTLCFSSLTVDLGGTLNLLSQVRRLPRGGKRFAPSHPELA